MYGLVITGEIHNGLSIPKTLPRNEVGVLTHGYATAIN